MDAVLGSRPHLLRLVAVAAACALLVAACGGSKPKSGNGEASKPAKRILADAQRAASTARSVHVVAHGVQQGQQISLDLSIKAGSGADGTFGLFGGSVEVIRFGGKVYLKGDRAFWQRFAGNGGNLRSIANRWVVAPGATTALQGLTALMSISGIASRLNVQGQVVNQGTKTFHGQQVIALRDPAENGTVYVSATGKPYPVALLGGKSSVTITFDHWNQPVTVRSPPKHAIPVFGG